MPRSVPHFKVRLSIQNHEKMAAAFADNDMLAFWVRLGVKAVERFADRTGDTFLVHESELPFLTGTKRGDSARVVLNKLVSSSPLVANYQSPMWTIHIPNFSEKQGFKVKNGKASDVSASASASSSSLEAREEDESPKPSRDDERFDPLNFSLLGLDTLPLKTANDLLAVQPRGGPETPETLATWFAWIAPTMRLRGHKDLGRTARKWWPRLRREDVEKAREWLSTRRMSASIAAERARAAPTPPAVGDFDDIFAEAGI